MPHAAGTSAAAAADTTLPVCLSMHIAITHHSLATIATLSSCLGTYARTHRHLLSCLVLSCLALSCLVLSCGIMSVCSALESGWHFGRRWEFSSLPRPTTTSRCLACNSPQTHCPFRSTCCCGRNDTLCQDRLRANQQKVEKNGPFRSCCTTRSWCAPIGRF